MRKGGFGGDGALLGICGGGRWVGPVLVLTCHPMR